MNKTEPNKPRTTRSKAKPKTSTSSSNQGNSGLFVLITVLVIAIGAASLIGPLRGMAKVKAPPASETDKQITSTSKNPEPEAKPDSIKEKEPKETVQIKTKEDEKKPVLVIESQAQEKNIPKQNPQNQNTSISKTNNTTGGLSAQQLFWVRVSDDGIILLERSPRNIRAGESPLTASINAMLSGPDTQELNQGLLSLVPKGTKLLSAYIQDGTAYLNFSEEFQFNPMGVEGAKASLKQIVYTATEFSNISSVQFLIDGKKQAFLGGDGVAIGKPIGRTSF